MITHTHIIDSGGLYGAEKVILNLLEEQQKRHSHPKLISIGDDGVPEKAIETESRKKNLDVIALRFKNGFNIHGTRQILSTLEMTKSDIIHSHGYKSDILLGLYPRHLRKIPMLSTLHGWTSTHFLSKMRLYEYISILSLTRIERVVAVSRITQDHQRLRMFGVKAAYIPNGIPTLDFDESHFSMLYPDLDDNIKNKFKILAVGRLSPEKGFDILIRALPRLNSRGIDCCLVIVGEGDERQRLAQLADQEGVANRVHMVGYVHDAYKMMPSFDVFALPSYTEGLPITILEAMQAGVPIVATTVGEVPEALAHGRCGHLVAPGDSASLSEIIEIIHRNRDGARMKAEAAKQRVHSEYSVERMTDKYMHEYERLLKAERR